MFRSLPRSILLLAVLILLATTSLSAADRADETATIQPSAVELTVDPLAFLNGHELPVLAALAADGVFAPVAATSDARYETCYTGCYPQANAICPPGQVAEALVSGPANDCALADIRCVDSCGGPFLQCRSFSPFC